MIRSLNSSYIRRACGLTACCFREITSTNTILKEYGRQGAPEWTVVIAEEQTAGRGRGDHLFFSPRGSGIYLSVLLRPKARRFSPATITAAAGVAACEAIEEISDNRAEIKWMNDVFCGGKKVAGILAEAAFLGDEAMVALGAGFNLNTPEGGFPEGVSDVAGSIFGDRKVRFAREKMAVAFFRILQRVYSLPAAELYTAYRDRLMVFGREVIYRGRPAVVTGLDTEYRLELTFSDGEKLFLNGGEISLKV